MHVEFWVRPGMIIRLNQIHVEDLGFALNEEAARRIFDQLLPSGEPKVPEFWQGHVWAECQRWVETANRKVPGTKVRECQFRPFTTAAKVPDEDRTPAKQVQKFSGRTYPVYNR